ncbi:Gfo/Idh/MocA family oxidoreductase [Microbacterium sp. NPDC089189]|uniref:Gfo/Idh/MocA family protein n=1 Tax=Microbacterium sp. NPDC089189 TaxID=3154972 RepID=UPI003432E48C
MARARWAILGTGAIARVFAAALPDSSLGVLHAVGSADAARADAFAREIGARVSGTYDDVVRRDDVDAVYVATVHTTHAEVAMAALAAGKPVLCEKPLAPSLDQTSAVLTAADRAQRPVVEAYKYRFTPFSERIEREIRSGRIGAVREIHASFGFAAPSRTGRLFDPLLAGGAIYDVGGYPVSSAVAIARWAGLDPAGLTVQAADGEVDPDSGVDIDARARLVVGDLVANVAASITRPLSREIRIVGDAGEIVAPSGWGSGARSASSFEVRVPGAGASIVLPEVNPFAAEADALVAAAAAGRRAAPQMPWNDSRATAGILDTWRAMLGR